MASKTITMTFEGKEYTLEFTRDVIRQMENANFTGENLVDKPFTQWPRLFAYALMAHHKHMRPSDRDRMYEAVSNKAELIALLIEMYREPVMTLLEDQEDTEGNAPTWTANF